MTDQKKLSPMKMMCLARKKNVKAKNARENQFSEFQEIPIVCKRYAPEQ